jgi:alkaline phosphatase
MVTAEVFLKMIPLLAENGHPTLGRRARRRRRPTTQAQGKATGVLTSVPFSHATPAAFGAQSASRNSYGAISEQMLTNPALDLIMGAGHPLFDADGRPRSSPDFRYVSSAAWAALQGPSSPRALIQTRADFEALAQGKLPAAHAAAGPGAGARHAAGQPQRGGGG